MRSGKEGYIDGFIVMIFKESGGNMLDFLCSTQRMLFIKKKKNASSKPVIGAILKLSTTNLNFDVSYR